MQADGKSFLASVYNGGSSGKLESPPIQQKQNLAMRIFLLFLLSLACAPGFAASHDQAHQRLADIITRGTLRVGTTGDYKPFSYRSNANSPLIGFDIDMARRLAARLGVKLDLVTTSWPSLMHDLAGDRFDIVMSGVSVSEARQKTALFSVAYLKDGKTPISLCAEQARFQTLAQIDQPSVRVIVNPGGTNESFVRANLQQAQIALYPDNNRIFDQILEGKAELMITDAIEARLQQRLKPTLCALHPESPFNYSEKAYLLPQDSVWKAVVDQWLQQNLEDGTVAKSLEKWLAHPWPQASPELIKLEPLRDLMAARLALMPDVARHKWNQHAAIEDLPREQKIIGSLQEQALALGVPATWAETFFRAQIEAAKQIQREHFALWQANQQGKFAEVPDLDTVIRPQLDELTKQLLRQLATSWPALLDAGQQPRIAQSMRTLESSMISTCAVKMAIAPLIDGSVF